MNWGKRHGPGVNGQSVVKRTKIVLLLANLSPKLKQLTCLDLSEIFSRCVDKLKTLYYNCFYEIVFNTFHFFFFTFSVEILGGGSAFNLPPIGVNHEGFRQIFVEIDIFIPMHPVFFKLEKLPFIKNKENNFDFAKKKYEVEFRKNSGLDNTFVSIQTGRKRVILVNACLCSYNTLINSTCSMSMNCTYTCIMWHQRDLFTS